MVGKTISHYKILAKLGEGGMGVVYKAEDTKLKRLVALKFLPSSIMASEAEKTRFIHEAQAAAALNHPNICTIYEIDEGDGQAFIAMEYIEGVELKKQAASGKLQVETIINIATQIAEGLKAAHAKGITHRDIKSANIMIAESGQVKIMDFGLAKFAGRSIVTKEGTTLGTVDYMSPEQARGEPVDHRTDIWSFGVVLYEMLTGQLPFRGVYEQAVMYSILNEEPDFTDQIPANFRAILQKALAKKPEERYQKIAETLADFNSLSTSARSAVSTPVRASSYSPLKRNRILFYAGLAVILLVAGFAYYFSRSRPIESIAVMPFVNASGNAEVEYLSDGMTETLISSLSRLPNLNVRPRSSVFQYKGKETNSPTIAKELNVQAILNGRVVQRGQEVSLFVELIDVALDKVVWSQQYNRKQSDLVTLQSDIALDVSGKLKSQLSGADVAKVEKNYTANPDAYQLYLKGRFFWNKRTIESLKQAAEFYKQAIEKDPNYALAYSGLAETYVLFSIWNIAHPADSMPEAKAAALKALELDDSLAEPHVALGEYLVFYEWDRNGGEKKFRRAIELKPDYATAHQWLGSEALIPIKRFDEAIAELKRAEELDPLSPIIGTRLGDALVFERRYEEAIAQYKRTLSLNPNFAYAHQQLGWVYGLKGMYAEAIAEAQHSIELNPDPTWKGYLAMWLAKAGDRGEARKLLDELKKESSERYVQSYAFAIIYIGLDEKENALTWLEKEVSDRAFNANYYLVSPELDHLRSEPRFKAMLKQLNLPE